MKKFLFSFTVVLLASLFSLSAYAQPAPGDDGGSGGGEGPDGSGTTPVATQPLGVHFTRNNGDGTCGGLAQIRLYYTTAPTVAPTLQQIYYQGSSLYSNFTAVTGNISNFATTGYVSFCLSTSNIPPAIKLTLDYKPGGTGQATATISGTD